MLEPILFDEPAFSLEKYDQAFTRTDERRQTAFKLELSKIIFGQLWKDQCYNGITSRHVDSCRIGGRLDMGGIVERLEQKSKDISEEVFSLFKKGNHYGNCFYNYRIKFF
jgi:hypothetical protein